MIAAGCRTACGTPRANSKVSSPKSYHAFQHECRYRFLVCWTILDAPFLLHYTISLIAADAATALLWLFQFVKVAGVRCSLLWNVEPQPLAAASIGSMHVTRHAPVGSSPPDVTRGLATSPGAWRRRKSTIAALEMSLEKPLPGAARKHATRYECKHGAGGGRGRAGCAD
jgi:hypothetical protein